jgi:hypothetical protein
MEIPAIAVIRSTIRTGTIYYFQEESFSSTEPHYFVVLNELPSQDKILILVCASSQIDKRKNAIKKLGLPTETLVEILPEQCPSFKKHSIFDCNSIIEKPIQAVIEKLELQKLHVCVDYIPKDIIEKLIQGVIVSPQVPEYCKKMLKSN